MVLIGNSVFGGKVVAIKAIPPIALVTTIQEPLIAFLPLKDIPQLEHCPSSS